MVFDKIEKNVVFHAACFTKEEKVDEGFYPRRVFFVCT